MLYFILLDRELKKENNCMELQTISEVSKTFGISARMLRYYEQIGLIKSLRQENNSYRFYDEAALKRLQQIILLRKLQIPVKQICSILDNPEAAAVIDIFKRNISELENEIRALSTIKAILENFVSEIEKITAIYLNLELLNEDSIQKLAKSLSLVQKNTKEKLSMNMEELNSASETINRTRQNLVRIVYRPTETVAKMWCEGCDPPDEKAKDIMEKFIKEADLFVLKPDLKVFSYGDGDGSWFLVTIPESLEVSAPFEKATFAGGLWAVVTVTRENNDGWEIIGELYGDWENINNKGSYRNAQLSGRPRHEVYFNPLNISNLKNTDLFNTVFNPEYLDIYIPIEE